LVLKLLSLPSPAEIVLQNQQERAKDKEKDIKPDVPKSGHFLNIRLTKPNENYS
jgi:hypothetical protein